MASLHYTVRRCKFPSLFIAAIKHCRFRQNCGWSQLHANDELIEQTVVVPVSDRTDERPYQPFTA